MSSSTLPELALELRPPWALLAVLMAWLSAVAAELWQVDEWPRAGIVASAALVLGGLAAMLCLAQGLFPGSLRRITWTADGTWRLCDGYGREWLATLAGSSRSWGIMTILVFSCGSRRWWAVLTPGTVGADPYRRLSVRWRLRRHA